MNWLRTISRELVGLVVDDVGFAAAIVGWIACGWLFLHYVRSPAPWHAAVFFIGLAAILLESVVRRAGASR